MTTTTTNRAAADAINAAPEAADAAHAAAAIEVGHYVRSFDFPDCRDLTGERACYVEGIVRGIGRFGFQDCDRYKIEVVAVVFGGKGEAAEEGQEAYPPVNGTPTWRGTVTNAVERIGGSFEIRMAVEDCRAACRRNIERTDEEAAEVKARAEAACRLLGIEFPEDALSD